MQINVIDTDIEFVGYEELRPSWLREDQEPYRELLFTTNVNLTGVILRRAIETNEAFVRYIHDTVVNYVRDQLGDDQVRAILNQFNNGRPIINNVYYDIDNMRLFSLYTSSKRRGRYVLHLNYYPYRTETERYETREDLVRFFNRFASHRVST